MRSLGRYFYEEGSIAWTIKTDEQVLKAVDILNKSQDYNSILQGKKGSILITHDDSRIRHVKTSLVENPDSRSEYLEIIHSPSTGRSYLQISPFSR